MTPVISEIQLHGLRVLVVEDDAVSAMMLARMLGKCGAVVDSSSNGRDALAKFEQYHYPVVVTDICMPGMDGLELVRRIRQIDTTVMFVATSANRDTECLISSIKLGFSDYFLKPLEMEKLLWAIKRCADTIADRQRLEDEQQKFRTVVECMSEGLCIKDLDCRITYQNRAMVNMFGNRIGEYCYTLFGNTQKCDYCPAPQDGSTHLTQRFLQHNGKTICVESTASLLRNTQGVITGSVEIIRDISEKMQSERLIDNIAKGVSSKIGTEYLSSLSCYLTEALEMDFALVGELTDNATRLRTLSFSHKGVQSEGFSYDLKGTPCELVISSGLQIFRQGVSDLFPNDLELRNLGVESYCGAPLTDSRGVVTGVLCTFHSACIEKPDLVSNIVRIFASRAAAEQERIKNEQTIRDMAFHDHLTGLANRRLFEDRLGLAIATARRHGMRFGLIYLDLDHFKDINDNHGHDAGDRVLVMTGERIRQCCRRDLDTISRQGGDEFCIIIEDHAGIKLGEIAEQLRVKIAEPMVLNGREIRSSASIGIACYPDDGQDLMEMEMAADRAMYAAKQSGRNTCCFATTPMH